MKKLIAFLFLTFLPFQLFAAEWSQWRALSQSSGATLEYRSLHRKEHTQVQWRVKNSNSYPIYASVRNKQYSFAGGRTESPSDEGSTVGANKTYSFVSDTVRGDVRRVSATLVVKKK